MGRYQVCVYAIAKNEEKFVDRWMDSMLEADLVVVTDTGSTDGTVEKLRGRGAVVFTEEVKPWRFDVARNLSLDHIPAVADICVCTDLDEVFSPGWREHLEQAWQPDTNTARYLYNWSHRPDGSPDMQFYYSKIHSRKGFRWRYPVHEYLYYNGTPPQRTVYADSVVLDHYPDPEKSRGSYLPLLETAVRENPEDDRMCYYLGREYLYLGRFPDCIKTLKRHLSLPASTWAEERCASMRWIAKSYHRLGKDREAYSWYLRAAAEAPHLRDPYVELAQAAYEKKDWLTSFFAAEKALSIREKSKTYVNMGYSWDHTPDDLCAIACYRLGFLERSAEHARKALELSPGNERLKNNLRLIEQALSK